MHYVVLLVELASKEVQLELDKIQCQLSEFLAAEENAMKERIRYVMSCELCGCHQTCILHLILPIAITSNYR